jgi:hypothetical protein
VEPKEFCDRWVPELLGVQPGEWGYVAACKRLLSSATGYPVRSIENWGKDFKGAPKTVAITLLKEHQLNEIRGSLGVKIEANE